MTLKKIYFGLIGKIDEKNSKNRREVDFLDGEAFLVFAV